VNITFYALIRTTGKKTYKASKEMLSSCKKVQKYCYTSRTNGIKVLVPLFSLINKLFGRKLFYVVIGGWLPTFLKNYKWLVSWLHHMDGIL